MKTEEKITHAIISTEIVLNHLQEIKHTNYYRQELKKKLNLVLPELIKAEEDFDKFFDSKEKETNEVYQVYDEFIKTIASVPIYNCEIVTAIIKAFNKNPKSLEGIVNKILKE